MSKNAKKVVITLAVIAAFVVLCVLLSLGKKEDFRDKYAGVDLTQDVQGLEQEQQVEEQLLVEHPVTLNKEVTYQFHYQDSWGK